MRFLCLIVALLSTLGCQQPLYIVIMVEDIPMNSRSLAVLADHEGGSTADDPAPFEIPQPAPASSSLLLYLPSNFRGDLGVSVGVFDMPNGQGCLLATGSGRKDQYMGPGDSLRVRLTTVSSPAACSEKRPLLLGVEPRFAGSDGGHPIKLTGWGFKPGITTTIDAKSATTTYVAASELQITTPPVPSLGMVPIKIINPSRESGTRNDLLRIYAGTLSFVGLSGATGDYSGLSALNIARYDPMSLGGFAVALSSQKTVRVGSGDFLGTRNNDYVLSAAPSSLYTVDIDKDGDLDLLVAADDGVRILRNAGNGVFSPETPFSQMSKPSAIVAGDLDSDGDIDIITVSKTITSLDILLNNGGIFLNNGDGYGTGIDSEPAAIALGDLNSDSLPDIAVGTRKRGSVQIYYNNPLAKGHFRNGMFSVEFPMGQDAGITSILVSDVNQNGYNDVIASAAGLNKILVYSFSQNTVNPYSLPTEATPKQLALLDVNNDTFNDIVVACSGANTVNIFLNKLGDGFKDTTYSSLLSPCSALAVLSGLDPAGFGLAHIVVGSDGCLATLANQSK